MKKRAVLQRPMMNPLLIDPVGPTVAPVAPLSTVAKAVPAKVEENAPLILPHGNSTTVVPVPAKPVPVPVSREAQLAAAKAAQLAALSKRRGFGRR